MTVIICPVVLTIFNFYFKPLGSDLEHIDEHVFSKFVPKTPVQKTFEKRNCIFGC